MAGVHGFEPGNAGIKNRCLTAWRYPNNRAVNRLLEEDGWGTGFEPGNAGIKTGALPLGDTPSVQRFLVNGAEATNSHTLRRQNLNLVRLPISPLPQKKKDGGYDGIRTCDPIIMSDVL